MAIARNSSNVPVLGDVMASSCKPAFAAFLTAKTIIGPILPKSDGSSIGILAKAELFRRNDLLGRFLHRREISIKKCYYHSRSLVNL
jgi:hypothetical protein